MKVGSVAGDLGERDGKTVVPDGTGDSPLIDARPSKKAKSASSNPEKSDFSLMDPGSPISSPYPVSPYSPPSPVSPYSPPSPVTPYSPPSPVTTYSSPSPVPTFRRMTEDYSPEDDGPIVINYDATQYIKTFICPPHSMDTRSRSILKAKEACLDPQIKRLLNWIRKEKEIEKEETPTKAQLLGQTKEFAEAALKHHYRDKETKYVLVKPISDHYFRDDGNAYAHVNFTAKQMDHDDSEAELFFAELTTREGRCDPEDRWFSTCCCVLKGEILGGCLGKSMVDPKHPLDLKHCHACFKNLMHPSGDQYAAGHNSSKWYYDYGLN